MLVPEDEDNLTLCTDQVLINYDKGCLQLLVETIKMIM